MTSLSAADPSPKATRRWLDGLWRSGGVASMATLGLPLLGGGLLLPQASLIAQVLQRAIAGHEGLGPLAPALTLLAGVLAVRIGLGVTAEIAATRASETIKRTLRATLMGQLLATPTTTIAAGSSGALSAALVEQVEALDGYLVRYLPAMLQAALLPLAFAAVLLPLDWMVGLILLVTAPLIPLFMALVGWGAEAATKQQAAALGRLGGRFADRLRGLTTLLLFGRAASETAHVAAASEELRLRTMRVMRIAFLSSAVLEFFAALGVAGVALYVGLTFLGLVNLRGGVALSLEAGLFCLLLAPDVFAPLRLLAAHYHDGAAAKAAAAEIAVQLGHLPALRAATAPAPAVVETRTGAAAVSLNHVAIAAPGGRSIIVDASLDVAAGQKIAILGASGIGKSTLLEAIARLRDYAGDLRLDGVDLRSIVEPALRGRVAMLGQRPRLFAGSIADNIRLGRPTACDTALALAARRAAVAGFAAELPDGLDTRLGEDGVGLSGGEIQRIALARIYLRNPGLVLLDEPTAHLDAATEAVVLDGLVEFARGRTLIVATHSEAVAARMDRVFRIAGGRLLRAPRPVAGELDRRGVA